MFNTPILFLIFNRPEETFKVFETIRQIRPRHLFIAADGPRSLNSNDLINCSKAKKILDFIDWDCELKTLLRHENLGCGKAVSSAISWFFSFVQEGIILEDDCLPCNDFFIFCELMLEKYRDDSLVQFIGGTNYQLIQEEAINSYYFSSFSHVWGWAAWRRTWENYDLSLNRYSISDFRSKLKGIYKRRDIINYWIERHKMITTNFTDTWDYQLSISILFNNGMCIIPTKNLVKNIGIGINSTHTFLSVKAIIDMKLFSIIPLIFNYNKSINFKADKFYFEYYLKDRRPWYRKALSQLKRVVIR
jgi:hypothetical protein